MAVETYKDYEHVYQCINDGCVIHGVVFPPATCPVCHKPVYNRHPKYFELLNQAHITDSQPIKYSSVYEEKLKSIKRDIAAKR